MRRHFVVLPALLVASACARPHEEEKDAKPVVTVSVAVAALEDVSVTLREPAVVHPRQQANVASRLTAVIQELSVRKGDRVAAGATLAKLDARDLNAQRAEALATLRQAEALTERRTRLFEEGAIPQRDLLATQTELAQAKARLDGIDTQLTFSQLLSPFAGTVSEQFLYPGDMAKPDSPVFTIMDLDLAVARGQVPETEAATIHAGQPCAFVPSDRPEQHSTGHITVVTSAVDPGRRTVEAWCEIANASGALLPGSFGELRIVTRVMPQSVVIPLAAAEFSEGTHKGSVVVVDAQHVAHRKEVVAGEVFDEKAQIIEGLAAADTVVVEGGYSLADGTTVRIAEKKDAKEKEKDEK